MNSLIIAAIIFMSTEASLSKESHDESSRQSKELHVEAFVGDRRILQLNVTLLQQMTSEYDITIALSSHNNSHCEELNHCTIHGVAQNKTSLTIPANGDFVTAHEYCSFQNDCSYKISAKALNRKTLLSTVYYVKECVNGLCLCRNAHLLPIPLMRQKVLNPKQINFEWEISSQNSTDFNEAALQYLTIDVYELRDCNLSWSETRSIASLHEKLDNYGEPIRKGPFTRELPEDSNAKCWRVRMSVVDKQNCHGPQFNSTISFPPIDKADMTLQIVLLCVAGAITTLVTSMLVVYGFIWKSRKKNIVNYWRGLYNNVQHNGAQMIPMRENILYFDKDSDKDWFEIPHSYISEIGREIGKGAFGRVYIARISDVPGKFESQIVAIKKLKKCFTSDQLDEFIGEISTMKKVGKHPNVVKLLGFCTLSEPYMMIMEFVPCGDLLKYLRAVRSKHESTFAKTNIHQSSNCNNNSLKHSSSNHSQVLGPLGRYLDILHSHSTSSASESSYITQPDSIPSTHQLHANGPCTSRPSFAETMYTNLTATSNPELTTMLNTNFEYVVDHNELHNFAIQIARGMKHLEDLQITHRDLAARNILIDENKTLKISDFGLSRTGIYVNTKNKKVPLRWLSIEAMKDNLYSTKSDIWAFAIVLWEIGTLGGFPYPSVSNQELLNFLKTGERLEKPENCSETLYELMLHCWAADPDDRPDFGDICKKLDPNKSKIYIDFSELSPNYVFPPTSDETTLKQVAKKLEKI